MSYDYGDFRTKEIAQAALIESEKRILAENKVKALQDAKEKLCRLTQLRQQINELLYSVEKVNYHLEINRLEEEIKQLLPGWQVVYVSSIDTYAICP